MSDRPSTDTELALIKQDLAYVKKRVDLIYRGLFFLLSTGAGIILVAVFKVILK